MKKNLLYWITEIVLMLSIAVAVVGAADHGMSGHEPAANSSNIEHATGTSYENATIKDILNKSSDYVGKNVAIEGKITQECPMRGCWITVDDGTGVLLVDFAPNRFTIPLSQIGNTAKVYGNVTLVGDKKKLTFEPGSPYINGKKVEITGDIKQPLVSTG